MLRRSLPKNGELTSLSWVSNTTCSRYENGNLVCLDSPYITYTRAHKSFKVNEKKMKYAPFSLLMGHPKLLQQPSGTVLQACQHLRAIYYPELQQIITN